MIAVSTPTLNIPFLSPHLSGKLPGSLESRSNEEGSVVIKVMTLPHSHLENLSLHKTHSPVRNVLLWRSWHLQPFPDFKMKVSTPPHLNSETGFACRLGAGSVSSEPDAYGSVPYKHAVWFKHENHRHAFVIHLNLQAIKALQ